MTFAQWREKYSGFKVEQPDPAVPVYMINNTGLPGGPLADALALEDYRVTSDALQAHYGPTIWLAPRVERDDWTRAEYMNRLIDHETFYRGLGRRIGKNAIARMILAHVAPLEKLREAIHDPRDLSLIPLARWDGLHYSIRAMVTPELMPYSWCGTPLDNPRSIVWSLSESVCVAKAIAREIAEEAEKGEVTTNG